jgi:ribonuclease HII
VSLRELKCEKYDDILWKTPSFVNGIMKTFSDYTEEIKAKKQGFVCVAGVDEAGCGALAGPVVAGAVVLPLGFILDGVEDSKQLTPKMRETAFDLIKTSAFAWATGLASVEEIEKMNIRQATFLAMRRALSKIKDVDFVIVDAWTIPGLPLSQKAVIRGDQIVKSISAASIVAKVTRDRLMEAYHQEFSVYGFDKHKGYGTLSHRLAIKAFGPCEIHRKTYKTFC